MRILRTPLYESQDRSERTIVVGIALLIATIIFCGAFSGYELIVTAKALLQ